MNSSNDNNNTNELSRSSTPSSTSTVPEPLELSEMKNVIKETTEAVERLQAAGDELSKEFHAIKDIYDRNANSHYNTQEKEEYNRLNDERVDREKSDHDLAIVAIKNGNLLASAEEAELIVEARGRHLGIVGEHLESTGVQLSSEDKASVRESLNKTESLKEEFQNKHEEYKNKLEKLEKFENKLEGQPDKEEVKQSLIDDYANLDTEIIDIMGFD